MNRLAMRTGDTSVESKIDMRNDGKMKMITRIGNPIIPVMKFEFLM
jgi:hypothetical protein